MDYHCYNSLGIGSVPPIFNGPVTLGTGNVLAEHATANISGSSVSLLPPHPSLMFHYGIGGKPTNVPPHLLSAPSTSSSINSNCINSNIADSNNLSNSKSSGRVTSTATAPVGTNLPPNTRSTSPNSSFAAALRSLAKQATGPIIDGEINHNEHSHEASPKPVSSSGPSASIASAPVASMAHPHYSLADMRKDGVLPSEIERLVPEELIRGFQPYRAPDMPIVSASSQLRQSLPMELAHAYPPYQSLYPHHLSHQYRLEEQIYLERYGLLRPSIPQYGMSSLYPTSPYLSTRFPPDILPNSLHPSSALLHERLMLEEDIRQREYELELRRERELERERERGREKERERRQKDEADRSKDERGTSIESLRDRSPLNHSTNVWNSTSSSSTSYSKKLQPGLSTSQQISRSSESRLSKQSTESLSCSSKSTLDSPVKLEKTVSKTRNSTIVRPFESIGPSAVPSCLPTQSLIPVSKPGEIILEDKKSESIDPPKSFSVWQPVKLTSTEPLIKSSANCQVNPSQPTVSIFNPFDHIQIAPSIPKTTSPTLPIITSISNSMSIPTYVVAQSPASSLLPLISTISSTSVSNSRLTTTESRLSTRSTGTLHQPFLTASSSILTATCTSVTACKKIKLSSSIAAGPHLKKPKIEPPMPVSEFVPVSRLDLEEKRLRELRDSGMLTSEAEETLLEESHNSSKYFGLTCSKRPLSPIDKSSEKLNFLSIFELTTHDTANQVVLNCCERRAEVLVHLAQFSSMEKMNEIEENASATQLIIKLAPGINIRETPKMKSISSLLVDFSGKSRFLQNLSMQPQHCSGRHAEIERIWKLVMEERLRRYELSKDSFHQRIVMAFKQLLQPPLSIPVPEDKSFSVSPLLPITSKTNVIFNSASIISPNKPSMKGIIEDRIFGIGKYLTAENDPLMTSLSGFDKMIDHFVKNAQAEGGNENTALLGHIEEVRCCQMAVCDTAEIVQEQVTKLIASRSQLEAHRAALHHHLTSITKLLASKNNNKPLLIMPSTNNNAYRMPTTIVVPSATNVSSSETNNENVTLTTPKYCPGQSSSVPNISSSTSVNHSNRYSSNLLSAAVVTSTKVSQATIPAATMMSWAGLPFLSSSNIPVSSKETVYYPHLLPQKQAVTSNSQLSTNKLSSVSSAPKNLSMNRTPSKIIPPKSHLSNKFNGAAKTPLLKSNIIKQNSKACSSIGNSPIKMTLPNKVTAAVYQNSKIVPYVVSHNATSNNKVIPQNKSPLGFSPYAKSSPNRLQPWLPN